VIITVHGHPAPAGSKKFMGRTKQGKGILLDQSDKTAPWRADVMTAARATLDHLGWPAPFDGPLVMRVVFSFLRPVTVKRAKRPYPSVYPDLSKLIRSTEDALKAAGVIRDDALICEYTRLAKVYCNEDPDALDRPGALIIIGTLVDLTPVGGTPPQGRRSS
jgi:Holliday junction resolvase